MRIKRTCALTTAVAAGVLTFGAAAPALAADTSATVTVVGGSLSITAPANAGNLGTLADTVLGGTISGPLGTVQVNAAGGRPAGSSWVATVISTAFTPLVGPTIGATRVGYTAGP